MLNLGLTLIYFNRVLNSWLCHCLQERLRTEPIRFHKAPAEQNAATIGIEEVHSRSTPRVYSRSTPRVYSSESANKFSFIKIFILCVRKVWKCNCNVILIKPLHFLIQPSVRYFHPRWLTAEADDDQINNRVWNSNFKCVIVSLIFLFVRLRSSWRSRRGRTTWRSTARACACTARRRPRTWCCRGSRRTWEGSSGCSSPVSQQPAVLREINTYSLSVRHTVCASVRASHTEKYWSENVFHMIWDYLYNNHVTTSILSSEATVYTGSRYRWTVTWSSICCLQKRPAVIFYRVVWAAIMDTTCMAIQTCPSRASFLGSVLSKWVGTMEWHGQSSWEVA